MYCNTFAPEEGKWQEYICVNIKRHTELCCICIMLVFDTRMRLHIAFIPQGQNVRIISFA